MYCCHIGLAKDRGSKLLQSNTIELAPATGLLKSLDKFLGEFQGKFDHYEQQAGDRCGSSTYKSEVSEHPSVRGISVVEMPRCCGRDVEPANV